MVIHYYTLYIIHIKSSGRVDTTIIILNNPALYCICRTPYYAKTGAFQPPNIADTINDGFTYLRRVLANALFIFLPPDTRVRPSRPTLVARRGFRGFRRELAQDRRDRFR